MYVYYKRRAIGEGQKEAIFNRQTHLTWKSIRQACLISALMAWEIERVYVFTEAFCAEQDGKWQIEFAAR
jgi:hypothetical protein